MADTTESRRLDSAVMFGSREELYKAVLPLIAKYSKPDEDQIVGDSALRAKVVDGGLEIDSLDTVEVLMAIEDDLGVHVDDTDAESFTTVDDAVDFLVPYLVEGAGNSASGEPLSAFDAPAEE